MSPQHEEETSTEQNFKVAQELTSDENSNKLNYWSNLIIEGIEEALFSLDTNWRFTYVNNQAAKIWNRERDGLVGKVMWQEFPILLGSGLEKFYRQAMAEGKPNQLETFSQVTQSWYEVRLYTVPHGLIVFFQDITRRKQIEQTLQESEARYRVLSEATFEGLALQENGVIVEANEQLAQLFGYSRQELVGKAIEDFVAPESRPGLKEDFSNNSVASALRICLRKDGSRFFAESKRKQVEHQGRTRWLVAVRDVSNFIQKEQELRESEKRFKVLSEAAFEGVIVHHDGLIIEVNKNIARMFGYSTPQELSGQAINQYFTPQTLAELQNRVAVGSEETYEGIAIKRDGTHFPVEARGKSTEYQGQSVRVKVLRDITQRNQAEENLRKTQEQLLQSQKMESIGRLAGGIAHDFNNLLTAITGYSELLLLNFNEEDPLYSDVTEIQKAANRAAALTRQLLAFSRQQVMQPRIINLNEVVTDMDKLLQRLIGEDIELRSLLDPDLGEVLADPGQIEQVIVNLAINARDAMPIGGKLTIETANVELDERYPSAGQPQFKTGSYVMLAVSDTGVGMDQTTQEKIFEPFFTTKEIGKGTGLGLSTVYGIVNQSEGYIRVYSELGVGTTFKIYLPGANFLLAKSEKRMQALLRSENSILSVSKAAPAVLEKEVTGQAYTVLIVEDDNAVRELIHRVLTEAGYIMLEAHNGQHALELLKGYGGKIDLVLTDIVMPQMGGQELIDELRKSWKKIKIVCMSGYTDRAVASHETMQEWDAFIQKPFSPTTLLSRVEEVLRASS